MSEHGATLQTYNQGLVQCLEELKNKRSELQEIINKEEAEKHALEKNLEVIQDQLKVINGNLKQHKLLRDSYNRTISDTESGFKKILESSQMLLNLALQESNKLDDIVTGKKLVQTQGN